MIVDRMRKPTLLKLIAEKKLDIPFADKHQLPNLRAIVKLKLKTYLEDHFITRCRKFVPQYPPLRMPGRNQTFLLERKLEFDFSWFGRKVAIEIHGGIDSRTRRSGHVSPEGMRRDIEKLRLAQLAGWILLPLTPEEVMDDIIWTSTILPMILKVLKCDTQKYDVVSTS